MKLLSIVLLCTILATCQGYRILGLFPFQGKSHFMMFEQLMKSLAKKGHQVDVISAFPLKKPYKNYNDIIVLQAPFDFMNNMTYAQMVSLIKHSPTHAVATVAGTDLCEHLNHPQIQKLIRNPPQDPPYDAVLMEVFGAHCFAIIAEILKVPLIGASSSILYPWSYDYVANPDNFAFAPCNLLPYSSKMNFWERMDNMIQILQAKFLFNFFTKEQTDIVRKYVSPDAPNVRELEKKISIVLVNSHFSLNGIKDLPAAVIEVGGLHVQDETTELSPSLEKWMNESTSGFFYFSFGSMLKIESMPQKYIDIFYTSMAMVAPVRVLMKIAKPEELPPGLPENVHVLPWIPQIKVLKHPNVRAFITHGGLMGTQEAITYGVPMIGIPLFADQFINIGTYDRKNVAIALDLETLTLEKMVNTMKTILNDPKYRDSSRKLSKTFLDRPLSAEATAVYWIEYVIRNGAHSLRSPAMDLTWWQIHMLDVCAFLLISALAALYILVSAVKLLFHLVNPRTVPQKKKIS